MWMWLGREKGRDGEPSHSRQEGCLGGAEENSQLWGAMRAGGLGQSLRLEVGPYRYGTRLCDTIEDNRLQVHKATPG